MRYVIINPGAASKMYGNVSYNVGIEPPYWVALRAAIIRNYGNSVKVIDAEAENLNPEDTVKLAVNYNPDIVELIPLGITPSCSSTPKMIASTQILREFERKFPNIMRTISGIHPNALPKQTERETHAVLCLPPSIVKLGEWPIPAWDLLPMERYRAHQWHCWGRGNRQPYGSLYSSFGCPYNCSFCTIHNLYDWPTIKYHTVERVMQEIDILHNEYGIANIKFADELFIVRKKRVLKLCKEIKKRNYGLNLWAYSRIDLVDEEIITAMLEAGFRWQCYGIESVDDKVRGDIGKQFSIDKVREILDMTRRLGAHLNGDFIFGLPEDDNNTMRATLDFAKSYLFEFVNFYVAMAYPGSQLYTQLSQTNIQLPASWDAYSQYSPDIIPLPTKYLTPAEVLQFRDNAFIEYYSNPEYLSMMGRKFGEDTVIQIKELLTHKLERKLLQR